MPGNNIIIADDFAKDYDRSVLNNNWNGPDVIFGLVQKILPVNSAILVLGIGTGESSIKFKQNGHLITGLDGSQKMLEQCEKKKIASKLLLHNIEKSPIPIASQQFDAVISNGLFHLVYPIKPVFKEINRILKPKGIFVFTFENTEELSESVEIEPDIWEHETKSGVLTYKYADNYVSNLLDENQFSLITQLRFLAFTNAQFQKNVYFTAIVAKLNQNH